MRYTIIPKANVTKAILNKCVQNKKSDLVCSLDGLSVILKWSGADPPVFSGDTKYSHANILKETLKPAWLPADPKG